jgi:hypothetical protein
LIAGQRGDDPLLMVCPFPKPGPRMQLAYRELDLAANGNDDQRRALHPVNELPRPWSPASCKTPSLRLELWGWLDAVVVWINSELVFDPVDVIPSCWPQHRHLVHELAVLADLRRRAEASLVSDMLEDWHRYALPSFFERMRHRVAEHCQEEHPAVPPASGRLARHLNGQSVEVRRRAFAADVGALSSPMDGQVVTTPLHLVDTGTGELFE